MRKPTSFHEGRETYDLRYWTEYDHTRIEREARALRSAYLYAFAARSWRAAKRSTRVLFGESLNAADVP